MNEYKIKVNLERGLIINPDIHLVQNDYNSTTFNFEFDDDSYEQYTKVFQLQYPDGTIWKKEIKDNKVTLANFDEEGNPVSILVQTGKYYFDIAVYDNDSKLTTTEKVYFNVREEITGEDIELDDRLPVLDDLINTVNKNLNETDNLDIDIEDSVITITKKDGSQHSENVKGDDYVITDEDYEEIENQVKSDIQPILENIENTANRAELISKGKAQAKVVKTFEELEEWLRDVSNKGVLNKGDDLYIEAVYTDETKKEIQPDYWVKEVLEEPNEKGYYYEISELGAEKPDLTEYAKKEQFVTLTQTEYDALTEKSANTYYFIIEEE